MQENYSMEPQYNQKFPELMQLTSPGWNHNITKNFQN